MNITPKSKKLSCKKTTDNPKTAAEPQMSLDSPASTSTPVINAINKPTNSTENVETPPKYFLSTADPTEDVNVDWDWNSPSQKKSRKQKRLLLTNSPKLIIKRHHPSMMDLEKFKEEVSAFRAELALLTADEENSLCISPVQESEFKNIDQPLIEEINFDDVVEFEDDIFNDQFDEQLVAVSQNVENMLKDNRTNIPKQIQVNKIVDDSFDLILQTIEDKDLELLSEKKTLSKTNNSTLLKRTQSDVQFDRNKSINKTQISTKSLINKKTEFNRTKSVELISKPLTQQQLNEIERKRLEALARRKRHEKTEISDSPIKYSLEEIEQKRLQALAKLKAKREEDIVEQKRQEALKRLNRRKNQLLNNSLMKKL